MKVELIDYTGFGHPDPHFAMRKLVLVKSTRISPMEAQMKAMNMEFKELYDELAYISKTIKSSWEFVDYTFRITDVTRAFTDQLVRNRMGSYAVGSQRIRQMGDFVAHPTEAIENDPVLHNIFVDSMEEDQRNYQSMIENGAKPEDARSLLPMATDSPVTCKYNLRTLSEMIPKRTSLRAQGEHRDVVAGMREAVFDVHPWTKMFLDPDTNHTPALDKLLRTALGDAGPGQKPEIYDALKELDRLKGVQ